MRGALPPIRRAPAPGAPAPRPHFRPAFFQAPPRPAPPSGAFCLLRHTEAPRGAELGPSRPAPGAPRSPPLLRRTGEVWGGVALERTGRYKQSVDSSLVASFRHETGCAGRGSVQDELQSSVADLSLDLFEGVRGKFNFWGRALSFQEAPSTHVSRLAARGAGGRRRRGGPRRAVLAVLYTRRLRAKVEHPGSAGAVNSLGVNERGGPRAGSAKAPHLESASSPATARTKRQGWSRAIQIRSRAAAATSEEDEGLQHLDAPGCPWMPGIPGTESTTMILS